MTLHEHVTVPHKRRQVDLASRGVWKGCIGVQVMKSQKAGIEVLHRVADTHRKDLLRIVISNVRGNITSYTQLSAEILSTATKTSLLGVWTLLLLECRVGALGRLPVLSTVNCLRSAQESRLDSLTCDGAVAAAQFRLYPSSSDEPLSVRSSLI